MEAREIGERWFEDCRSVLKGFAGSMGKDPKTHLATALGLAACNAGIRVRFAVAIDIINSLLAAQKAVRLAKAIKDYTRPRLLMIDEPKPLQHLSMEDLKRHIDEQADKEVEETLNRLGLKRIAPEREPEHSDTGLVDEGER